MAEIALSVSVSRPTGGALDINSGPYKITSPIRPGLTWRRNAVTGRWVPGERLLDAVPDTAILSFTVRVDGDDWAEQSAAALEMFQALAQFEYTVTVTQETVATVWTGCQMADIVPRETADTSYRPAAYNVKRGRAEYVVTIRCNPLAIEAAS